MSIERVSYEYSLSIEGVPSVSILFNVPNYLHHLYFACLRVTN